MGCALLVRCVVLGGLVGLSEDALGQSVGCIWDRQADAPIGRFEAGSVLIDDQLYLFGGYDTAAIEATDRVDRYDPSTGVWTQRADLPSAVTHAPFVYDGDHVWMLGGFVGDHPGVATADVWLYDIDQDVWSQGPSLPRPIASGGAVQIGREVHYISGCEADRNTMTGDHWAYDLDAPLAGWQARAPLPVPRCHVGAVSLGGEIWALGGQVGHDVNATDVPYVHRYRPDLDTWSTGPSLPRPRSHFESATFVADQRIYIAGGQNRTVGLGRLSGMLELDPVSGAWTYLPQLPFARQATCVRKIGDFVYMAGGSNPGTPPGQDLYRRDWAAEFPSPFRINCGGRGGFDSTGGCCWCGDIGSVNGAAATFDPSVDIAGTDEDAVFHVQRRSSGSSPETLNYRFPMGNGFFRLRAHLAERVHAAGGARVQSLFVEGHTLALDLDLASTVGLETAWTRAFDVEVTDHVLNISLAAQPSHRAKIAALEIERLGDGHIARTCVSAPNSTGQPGTLETLGNTSVADDDLTFVASGLPASTVGLFVQASQPGQFQLPGGTLCVAPPLFRLPLESGAGDELRHRLQIANPAVAAQQITAGSTWHFQCWHRDVAVASGYGLTDSLRVSFTP